VGADQDEIEDLASGAATTHMSGRIEVVSRVSGRRRWTVEQKREFLIKNEPNFRDQVKRFAQQLRASGFSPHIIGDAAGVGFVEGAMRSAATVARAL